MKQLIRREHYLDRIRPFVNKDVIKVLTGMRRTGKSAMLELIREDLIKQGVSAEQFISLNFESFRTEKLRTARALYDELADKIEALGGRTAYVLLDEIQEVTEWEKCVNSLRVDYPCDIFITGSNARLLSSELATLLSGRYVTFEIFPFSFAEHLEGRSEKSPDVRAAFLEYVERGGMPFFAGNPCTHEDAVQYLSDIFQSVILKDIVKRHAIRDVDLLERIIKFVMSNVGRTFSARSVTNFLKSEKRSLSTDTVLNYLNACLEAFLFERIRREDLSGKRILTFNEKYFIVDHGIREAICGGNTQDMDQILENIICLELLRRGWAVTVGRLGDKEIDFIGSRNGKRIYIQVAYLLASAETVEREFGVLRCVRDNHPKFVVSLDEVDMSRDGIRHMNVGDFLLADDWV